jgi:hypothetical protein
MASEALFRVLAGTAFVTFYCEIAYQQRALLFVVVRLSICIADTYVDRIASNEYATCGPDSVWGRKPHVLSDVMAFNLIVIIIYMNRSRPGAVKCNGFATVLWEWPLFRVRNLDRIVRAAISEAGERRNDFLQHLCHI